MALLQVVYQSHTAGLLSDAEVERIRTVSTRRNQEDSLTGVLFQFGHRFVGILEGEEALVLKCLERVATDSRHVNMRVLREAIVPSRKFLGWVCHRIPSEQEDHPMSVVSEMFASKVSKGLKDK